MLTFRKLEHAIVGTINGKPFNVARTEDVITALETMQDTPGTTTKDVLDYIKGVRDQEIAGSNKYLTYKPTTKEYFLALDGKRSKHPIPEPLVKFIQESYGKDTDFMPILKAWARLLANPYYNSQMGSYFAKYLSSTYVDTVLMKELMNEENGYSEEAAREMATYQDIAIAKEGLMVTYKVANIVTWEYVMIQNEETKEWEKQKNPLYKTTAPVLDSTTGEVLTESKMIKPDHLEDFLFTPAICKHGDKFYSDGVLGYVYQVGKMQKLPKNALRNLDNTFGGGGLYIGGLNYIEHYRSSGSHVLTCLVNPGDILSFQDNGSAIRVDALFPNNVWEEEESTLKSIYHSSDYDEMSTARLEELMARATEDGVDLIKEQEKINKARENGAKLEPDSE